MSLKTKIRKIVKLMRGNQTRGNTVPETPDEVYYRRIFSLIPELEFYKVQTIEHLKERAKTQGCEDLKTYYDYLRSHPEEVTYMKTNLTLKGTHFFRGNDWDAFREKCLAEFAGKETVKVWCASCSSGEEVFSVIMCLLDYMTLDHIEVLASDYNAELLEKCRIGEYFLMHRDEIPGDYQRYVVDGKPKFSFPQEMKNVIRTKQLNLLTDPYPHGFDVVLCRNTIKFFSPEAREDVKRKLAETLNPGGFLFLSADDDHRGVELIEEPEKLGLRQIDGRCIYRKDN